MEDGGARSARVLGRKSMTATEETIAYYDGNAKKFIANTANIEFSALQKTFADMLPEGGRILDLGCGSGRDSLAFLKAGLSVDAVDGSAEMVKAASELTGLRVEHATFADFEPRGAYDGIWACSSLLHVPAAELPDIVAKYAAALKPGGRFYLSFKIGDHDGMRNGRWFTDMTEQSFRRLVDSVEGLTIDRIGITSDVRPGRSDEKWLNAWCVRI